MKKKVAFGLFILVILGIPLFLMIKSEDVLNNGIQHKIQLRGYDPFDPFRGKYIRLNYDNFVKADPTLEVGDIGYVALKKGEDGFSTFDYMHSQPPEGNDYFESIVLSIYDSTASFRTDNISKYFINENKAQEAENVVIDYRRDRPEDIYVAVRVLDGEIRLEDIFVEETPLLDFLEQE
ncbi:MAG: GDYXXLXY domain-containing protein [Flavobacteriales bacterium]|nr:GDYXXLXY domain-containing protein [Flavobacteriales bacterium]